MEGGRGRVMLCRMDENSSRGRRKEGFALLMSPSVNMMRKKKHAKYRKDRFCEENS